MSDELYENMVFSELQKENLFPALDALKAHGPRGMDLWIKFKDDFQQNSRLLSAWILEKHALPERVVDEIDEWACGVKSRGFYSRGRGRSPGKKFILEQGTGGIGKSTRKSGSSPPPEQRKYYRHP